MLATDAVPGPDRSFYCAGAANAIDCGRPDFKFAREESRSNVQQLGPQLALPWPTSGTGFGPAWLCHKQPKQAWVGIWRMSSRRLQVWF